MEEIWYTPEELAGIFKINKLTVYKYIKKGKIRAIKIGRHYRIAQKDLGHFIKKSTVKNTVNRAVLKDVLPKRDYWAVREAKKRLLKNYSDRIKITKVYGSKIRGQATKEPFLIC